jgi:hypothetical protein
VSALRSILGHDRSLDKPWLLQRCSEGRWFDSEGFDSEEAALAGIKLARYSDSAGIKAAGGENWSGRRTQKMRIVRVVES